MRQFMWAAAAVALLAVPVSAQAGFVVEASLGSGVSVTPERHRLPTNVMIAPGYGLGSMIRAEVGLVADMGDVDNQDFNMQVRPMLVIDPPLLPFYARGIFAITNLVGEGDTVIAYGGALGVGGSLFGAGVFGEVGVLPLNKEINGDKVIIVEARAGVYYSF